ncbi:hypothetical protein CDD83_549 [Cordyceps sp. RAO-2017]|nr:hypothetical protein CDD83_549 [Cordyceps sp. RAO-2017]
MARLTSLAVCRSELSHRPWRKSGKRLRLWSRHGALHQRATARPQPGEQAAATERTAAAAAKEMLGRIPAKVTGLMRRNHPYMSIPERGL